MKKIAVYLLCGVLLAGSLSGCGKEEEPQAAESPATVTVEKIEEQPEQTETEEPEEALEEVVEEEAVGEETVPIATMIASKWNSVTNDDYEHYRCYLTLCEEGLIVMDPGYESLQRALQEDTEQALLSSEDFYQKGVDRMKNDKESDESFSTWNVVSSIDLCRADEKIVSYWRDTTQNMEDPGEPVYRSGRNYDPATGKTIELYEITSTYEEIYELFLARVKETEVLDDFYDGWEDSLSAEFYGDIPLDYTIDSEKLSIVINADTLAPKSYGLIQYDFPFAEYETIIASEYIPTQNTVKKANHWGEYCIEEWFDADGDGKDELLQIDSDIVWNEEYQYAESTTLLVSFGTGYDDLKTVSQETEDGFSDTYLMKTTSGSWYLYVNEKGMNDYQTLAIFDLSNPEKGPVSLGMFQEDDYFAPAFYGLAPVNANHFNLERRIEILGTRSAYRAYRIKDNGLPVNIEEEWKFLMYDPDSLGDPDKNPAKEPTEYTVMTLKQDLECEVFESAEDRENSTPLTIPSGTVLRPYSTDGETYMVFELEDGTFCKVVLDPKDPEMWTRSVNGINEMELFDGIVYAG